MKPFRPNRSQIFCPHTRQDIPIYELVRKWPSASPQRPNFTGLQNYWGFILKFSLQHLHHITNDKRHQNPSPVAVWGKIFHPSRAAARDSPGPGAVWGVCGSDLKRCGGHFFSITWPQGASFEQFKHSEMSLLKHQRLPSPILIMQVTFSCLSHFVGGDV